ncbi:MAG TPA: glycosyltransferase family 39 protein, partial [Candidatus Binatia bacterium]|nr:glycosyltransferase family 39 protein [Candidatus Binatia bacterium]
MIGSINRFAPPLAVGALLLIFGLLAVSSSLRQSPTVDESVHLLGGYSYLKWGDYRVNPEHPPLVKIWAALPLLWLELKDPRPSNPTWNQIIESEPGGPVYPLARETFFNLNDAAMPFFYGKLQMLLIGAALGLFVYLWSRRFFGAPAAIAPLLLYCFDPNILAHSTIIHTDVPFAAVFFIGTFVFWRASNDLTWLNLSLTMVLFGLAAITKHFFVVLVPIWLALGLWKVFSSGAQTYSLHPLAGVASTPKQKALLLALLIGGALAAGYAFIWAAYGFRFNAVPDAAAPLFMTQVPAAQQAIVEPIQALVLGYRLAPEAFVAGYLYNLKIWKHSAYLLGQISPEGFWSYFPIAFAVKTPVPVILLSALAIGMLLSRRKPPHYLWI